MFFLRLIRVLAAILAIWLIGHLLYALGRKSLGDRDGPHQAVQNGTDKARRKFVESSVVEKKAKTSENP